MKQTEESWEKAYHYGVGTPGKRGAVQINNPSLTDVPFNDAYWYMDWLLTVALLLVEILIVMKLDVDA